MPLIILRRIAVTVALTVLAAGGHAAELRTRGNTLLVADRVVADDPAGIEHPQLSPDATRVAWAHRFNGGSLRSAIVIARTDGTLLRTIPLTADHGINAILRLGWLDGDRIWIEGHVTPSSGIYYVWNAATGEQLDERWGSWFTPSPGGKHIAQLEHAPQGAPWRPHLLIDGAAVYPKHGAAGELSDLTWSPDGRMLAFVERNGKRRTALIVGGGGAEAQRLELESGERVTAVQWLDDGHLRVEQGRRTRELALRR